MKKSKILIVCITVILMSMILCSCNKQKDKITLSDSTLDKISELEDKYGVTINYCNVPVEENIKFEYEIASNADEIAEAVEAAEIIFSRLPDGWVDDIKNSYPSLGYEINNMNFLFCEELEGDTDNFGNEIRLWSKYTCIDDTIYMMVDIHNFEPEVSIADAIVNRIYHLAVIRAKFKELSHEGETELEKGELISIFTDYLEGNPSGFEYYNRVAEISENDKQYVYGFAENIQDVYFINEKSLYSIQLDCRQLIAPLLYTNEYEQLPEAFESEHIRNKAENTLFWFDYFFFCERAYWHRWFE